MLDYRVLLVGGALSAISVFLLGVQHREFMAIAAWLLVWVGIAAMWGSRGE